MKKLQDKVAVVTGAGSGLGRSIALLFASEGAKLVIADLAEDSAQKVVEEIKSRQGEAMAVVMDVSNEDQVNAGIDAVVKHFGGVDVLVSNAGIQIINPVDQFKFSDWKRLLSIHLDGAFLTTKACLRHMYPAGKGGSILYMGSVYSKDFAAMKSAYVTAKHGLIGFCQAVADEGAKHGVRANVICPGFVKTPLVEKQIPEQAKALHISEDEVINSIMLGKTVDHQFTTLDDVAQTALFFASFGSNALTGQSLLVTHGWFME